MKEEHFKLAKEEFSEIIDNLFEIRPCEATYLLEWLRHKIDLRLKEQDNLRDLVNLTFGEI